MKTKYQAKQEERKKKQKCALKVWFVELPEHLDKRYTEQASMDGYTKSQYCREALKEHYFRTMKERGL